MIRKLTSLLKLAVLSALVFAGCGQADSSTQTSSTTPPLSSMESQTPSNSTGSTASNENSSSDITSQVDAVTELYVTFLAFEFSSVTVQIDGTIDSVMNPTCGTICAEAIGELIMEKDKVDPSKTKITGKSEAECA